MGAERSLIRETPGAGRRPRETTGGDTNTVPWADLTTHISAAMKELIAARGWLKVLASLAKRNIAQLTARPVL